MVNRNVNRLYYEPPHTDETQATEQSAPEQDAPEQDAPEQDAPEQSAPEQDAPVVEDDILLANEESHTAINDHSYSQTSNGCQTSRLMWMAMAKHMVPADKQTKLLIHLRKELDDEFLSCRRHNEDLWAKFTGTLHAVGFRGKTRLQVNTKWNDLRKKYRKAKVNSRSTGWACKNFPFEDEMDDFIWEKASTN